MGRHVQALDGVSQNRKYFTPLRCCKEADLSSQSIRALRIRHLKTAYGDYVDLERRVVGDLFDDRGTDGNIRNSILEVHRYPPEPDEFQTLQRFSSLAPNSSARPRKRPLELPSQSYTSQYSRNMHREVASIEGWDDKIDRPFGTATKRQRTREARLDRTYDAHQPLILREEQVAGLYHSSQVSGTQESIHQILDSQKSPGKKRKFWLPHLSIALLTDCADPNPYGTPTSLSLIGPQESIPGNEIDLSAIPDSPLGSGASGGAMQLDRKSTKSESPELRASVREVPTAKPIDASVEQPILFTNSQGPSTIPSASNSALQPVSISQTDEEYAKNHRHGSRQVGEKTADVNSIPNRGSLAMDPPHALQSKTSPNSDPIFDLIESDTESFHEKQKMHGVKRPESGQTASHATQNAGADRRNGPFLVPPILQSRRNGARIFLDKVPSPGQRANIQEPRFSPSDANMSIQNDLKKYGKHTAKTIGYAESKPCSNDRATIIRETPKKNIAYDTFTDKAQNPSRAATAGSQDSDKSTNGTIEMIIQQRDDLISNQEGEQEPYEKTHPRDDPNNVVRSPDDNRYAQEAEQQAAEAEKHQEKKAEKDRLDHEVMEKKDAAKEKEAVERKATDKRLADDEAANEEKARAEELAQVRKAKAKEVKLAETKRAEEIRENEARLAKERTASETQTREMALTKEANKLMLAAEGAKQIEAEREEKEKARSIELAAKKRANEVKVEEQARETRAKKKAREEKLAREKAQQLEEIKSNDAKQRTQQATTAQEDSTALRELSQECVTDRELQKLRDSSEKQSRASTTPLASLSRADPNRSMTPIIPRSSVTRSSSHQRSLGSSPLSNRSSGNMDAPLRSALRQSSSASRRSLSSVSFNVLPPSRLNKHIPSTPRSKSLTEINHELATKSASAQYVPKIASKTTTTTLSETPMKTHIPKKAPDSMITKNPTKNGKVQTKLNVTREVAKPKGSAGNLSTTSTHVSKQAPKQEIVLSSGEDSSNSEEPVWQTGNAKAGPSSRKPTFLASASQGAKTAHVESRGPPIDPTIRNIKVEKAQTAGTATLPRSDFKSDTNSLHKSTSRSPALALSETISLSSDSSSSSVSSSDSDLESEEEEGNYASSQTSTPAKNGKLAPVTMDVASKADNVGIKQLGGSPRSERSSQPSQASSRSSHSTVSVHDVGKHANQAAERQLQLESRKSVPNSSSNSNGTADDKVINQGLNHAGRLPNGTRPAYYKYPGFSELQKVPPTVTPMVKSKLDTSISQASGASSVKYSEYDDSGSDSDDASSSSDEDEDVDEAPRQTDSTKKSSRFPGMGGVMKRRLSISWRYTIADLMHSRSIVRSFSAIEDCVFEWSMGGRRSCI